MSLSSLCWALVIKALCREVLLSLHRLTVVACIRHPLLSSVSSFIPSSAQQNFLFISVPPPSSLSFVSTSDPFYLSFLCHLSAESQKPIWSVRPQLSNQTSQIYSCAQTVVLLLSLFMTRKVIITVFRLYGSCILPAPFSGSSFSAASEIVLSLRHDTQGIITPKERAESILLSC